VETSNTRLERATLGALITPRNRAEHLIDSLAERDFADPFCASVYRACVAVRVSGRPLDYTTAREAMLAARIAPDAVAQVADLGAEAIGASPDRYVEAVRELAVLRRLAVLQPARIVAEAESPADALGEIRAVLDGLDAECPRRTVLTGADMARATSKRLEEAYDAQGALRGLSTGLTRLDDCFRGLRAGALYVVAGRPGSGKTALGLNIAARTALKANLGALVFSLEMSAAELGDRLLASEARLNGEAIAAGRLEQAEWARTASVLPRISDAPLWIDERAGTRIEDLTATARKLHAERRLSLVVVDYLQLVRGGRGRRDDSREQEVAEVSRGLKALAKVLACPVIALAQLNRGSEQREDKRPRLSDLRESGAIEADADAVAAVHRPAQYSQDADPNIAEILVLKHRHGRTGIATVRWSGEMTRFDNLEDSR